MGGDERGFDQLDHGKAGDAFILAEVDDLGITEPFHADEVAEFSDELVDFIRVPDCFRGAVVDVDAGRNAPRRPLEGFVNDSCPP